MNTKSRRIHKSTGKLENFCNEIFRNLHLWSFVFGIMSVIFVGPTCLSLLGFVSNKVPTDLKIVQDWERIGETHIPEKFFVYSAFYDYLGGDGVIKILGATTPTTKRNFYCHLLDKELNHFETVGATSQVTRHASRELPMSPVTVFCKLNGLRQLPSFVSLSPRRLILIDDLTNTKVIPVILHNPNDFDIGISQHRPKNRIEFAACVQPTYNYDDVWQLLQWIEFQMLMGVEHFTFYNISIGSSASCLIQHYNRKFKGDLISVLPWHNIHKIPELHNNGQVLQATDCVARYKSVATFVVILDFDEYILPRRNLSRAVNNYNELIQFSLKNVLNSSQGVFPVQFQFRSGLFGLGFPEFKKQNSKGSDLEVKVTEKLSLLKHVTRLKHIKPFHYRAKFITTPEFVTEPGIHSMVHATPRNGIELLIPETVAYVHHYRNCNWAADCGGGKEIVEDITGHFWAEKLLPKVMTRYQEVVDLCGIQL